jgi:hypothetical protein
MIHTPITVNSIGGVHNAFTETGGNGTIQNQLITPATLALRRVAMFRQRNRYVSIAEECLPYGSTTAPPRST